MDRATEAVGRRRRPAVRGAVGVAILAGFLAGCASSGSGGGVADRLFASRPQPKPGDEQIDPDYFLAVSQCPEVEIRTGTESYRVYERGGEDDPQKVRYQGSITNTARECRDVAGQLTLKVGVEGRVVGGPAARAGTIKAPVRIAVVSNGDKVLFSELFEMPVDLAAPDFAGEFVAVQSVAVPIPQQGERLRIYVGFDSQAPGRGRG